MGDRAIDPRGRCRARALGEPLEKGGDRRPLIGREAPRPGLEPCLEAPAVPGGRELHDEVVGDHVDGLGILDRPRYHGRQVVAPRLDREERGLTAGQDLLQRKVPPGRARERLRTGRVARIARLRYIARMDTTIRNLDEAAYRELKARAAVEGKTIGQAVNDAIKAYLATPDPRRKRRSLRGWKPESYPPGNERLSMEVNDIYGTPRKPGERGTAVDLSDEIWARLGELAAGPGEGDISALVLEAVEFYLRHRAEEEKRIDEALSALGSLNDVEADRLRDSVRRLRATWR